MSDGIAQNPPIEGNDASIDFNTIDYKQTNTAVLTSKVADARYIAVGTPSGIIPAPVYTDPISIGGYGSATRVQESGSICIGGGNKSQKQDCVAIGTNTAMTGSQQDGAVAISSRAGEDTQGINAVAGSYRSGTTRQGDGCLSLGYLCGEEDQSYNSNSPSVSIGRAASRFKAGAGSLTLGRGTGYGLAGSSSNPLKANNIVISGTGQNETYGEYGTSRCHFATMRGNPVANMSSEGFKKLYYDDSTNEIIYDNTA